jgi:hypothetical protein
MKQEVGDSGSGKGFGYHDVSLLVANYQMRTEAWSHI